MSIDAITAVGADMAPSSAIKTGISRGADFLTVLGDGLARVDGSIQTADTQLRALAAGQDIPIHDVMITMEQARLDLMLVAEVRNRLIEGYQELTRMQL
jgi:flagellar hook-basal body complex protein FliE